MDTLLALYYFRGLTGWQTWALVVFEIILVSFTVYFTIYSVRFYRYSKMRLKGDKVGSDNCNVIIDAVQTNRTQGAFFANIDKSKELSNTFKPDALAGEKEK